MRKIIFLCHGNICRSPLAEFIMKDEVLKRGLENEFEIASKALSNEEIGNDIYPPIKRILDKYNIPYSRHYASKFNKQDYEYYDEIYLMDNSNLRLFSMMMDDIDNKVKLLNGIIDDPWYTRDFEKTYRQIKEGVNNLL